MRKLSKLMLVGIVAILAVGCSSSKKEEPKPVAPVEVVKPAEEVVETVVVNDPAPENTEDMHQLLSGYAVDQYVLDPSQISQIENIANYLSEKYKNATLDIIGHTDNTGTYDYNMALGLRRAKAVEKVLLLTLDPSIKVRNVTSDGYNNNVASNDTKEGRAQNRRVEINVIK